MVINIKDIGFGAITIKIIKIKLIIKTSTNKLNYQNNPIKALLIHLKKPSL